MANQDIHTINFELSIELNYTYLDDNLSIAASKELDSMDISDLSGKIVDFPNNIPYTPNSDEYFKAIVKTKAYKKFVILVNKVDRLLELRGYDILGESEFTKTGTESKYRGIVLNISKDVGDTHLSGKVMHTLRFSGHKETRTSRKTRWDKIGKAAESKAARDLNNGKPLEVGQFESFVVKCTAKSQELAKIENKEFFSYTDIIRCVDLAIDRLEEAS